MLIDEMDFERPHYAVAVYDEQQHYGGPEEGGWWYYSGTLVGVAQWLHNEDVAYEVARQYNARFEKESWNSYKEGFHATVVEVPRKEYPYELCHSDMEPDPNDRVTRWDVPTHYPEERPHYC